MANSHVGTNEHGIQRSLISKTRFTWNWKLSNFDACNWEWSFPRVAIGLNTELILHCLIFLNVDELKKNYTHWCSCCGPLQVIIYMKLLAPWNTRKIASYFHFYSKALWKIPNDENIIHFTLIFSILHAHQVSNRVSKYPGFQQGRHLNEIHH